MSSSLNNIGDLLPEYAKDLKLNLGAIIRQPELTQQQTWGSVATAVYTCRSNSLLSLSESAIKESLTPEAVTAAKTAAAIMGMNNIFYRFGHLAGHERYLAMPAKLRMSAIKNHGVDELDFELWCLVASAVNGCGLCIESHEKILREKGMPEDKILAGIRISAVIHGVAITLEQEEINV